MFVSSLKPDDQIFGDLDSIKAFLPVGDISLDNYTGVFDRVPAARFLINSIAISAVTVVLGHLRQQPGRVRAVPDEVAGQHGRPRRPSSPP